MPFCDRLAFLDGVDQLLDGDRDRPLVFVTVGSDHHPFDRLVGWMDSWAADRAGAVDCVVQYGTAAPPVHAVGADYVDHLLLERLLDAADVVVVQGGPMSIIECREHGKRPLVIPRIARLGEVVDDHQRTFCAKLASEGRIHLIEDAQTLAQGLDAALADPSSLAVEQDPGAESRVRETVARVQRTASSLLRGATRDRRPAVLMLGGAGRSGSTLLERMLDQVPGVTALGEVVHLWERGLLGDELCGCGNPFSTCPFWSAVGGRAFGGWQLLDPREFVTLTRGVVRTRFTPALLGAPTTPSRRLMRDRLARALEQLLRAAREESAARVLVDSSKHHAHALLLRRSRVALRCVFVVRDPRAVAYSWRRAVPRPEVVGRRETMPRYGLAYSSFAWTVTALMFELVRSVGVPVLVVRYEDLVANPGAELRRVLDFAGIAVGADPGPNADRHVVHLAVSHTVAGNPMRFTTGQVALRADDEWRRGLSTRQQRLVFRITAAVRRRYGYC